MIVGILAIIIVCLLKVIGLIGDSANSIVSFIGILLGIWFVASLFQDVFSNIPKTLSSPVHPNYNPLDGDPSDIYKELWAEQKKGYMITISITVLCRLFALYLICIWFV